MFESLADKLQKVFDGLSSRGKLSEADVDSAMREVRLALLEADVNYKVVKDLVARVKERAVGAEVMRRFMRRHGIEGRVIFEDQARNTHENAALSKAHDGFSE